MKAKNLRWVAFLLVGVLPWTFAARAQEEVVPVEPEIEPVEEAAEAPPAQRPETRFLFEIGYLAATTVGGDHRIGTEYAPETATFRTLYMPEETASGTLYRAGWKLPEEWGEIVGRYWTHKANTGTVVSRPGDFVFGITETIPFVHGIADDGLADAVMGKGTGMKCTAGTASGVAFASASATHPPAPPPVAVPPTERWPTEHVLPGPEH